MRGWRKALGLLAGLMLAVPIGIAAAGPVSAFAANAWTGIADNDVLVSDTVTPLANGVTQHEVVANNEAGTDQNIEYFAEIDLNRDDIELVAGYGDNSADKWQLTRTTDMAKSYERDNKGKTVVAAVNADFFNMATGEPMGALVMEGEVKHQSNGRWYFGVTKDGKAVIRNTADLSDLQMAVGGNMLIAQDGKPLPLPEDGFENINYARCAVGIKADGTVLTVTSHGNFAPTSNGRPNTEIAQMMVNAGCQTVLELDAGGSATFASRAEGEDGLTVKNSPRDGAERYVSSSLLIVSSSTPTGEFDHASLSPNNLVYTPGSEVQFSAKGVDTAGAATDLPAGVQYQLAPESASMGSIDAQSGLFKGNDSAVGTVTVNMTLNGEVVGSTSIELATPDEIYFGSEEVSLGFEETSDLGLVLRNQKREIIYKDGDIIWNVSDPKMGSFTGNMFTSSDGESLEGTVTATSAFDHGISGQVKVIVGKLPTIVWDFEDKTNEAGEVVTTAEDYYIGTEETPGILSHSNYARGGKESIEIVSIDDDEPVRFGEKSLKLNYDFTQCGEVTEGACVGTSEQFEIPGAPTGIGVWVYAPEGVGIDYEGDGSQAGFWLRGYVEDGGGNNQPYDFTLEPKHADVASGNAEPGIYWEGWKYLEADLTHLAPPYKIQQGMTFRLMYVAGTKMGTKTANSIYFDNLQFVYGTNVDDVDSPVVDSIQLNDEELEDGAKITDNQVNITAAFHDVENKYTSNIDPSTVRLQIDGVNVLDNDKYEAAYDESLNRAYLYNCELLDGTHSVTVSMKDNFGNDVSETRHFTVDTGSADSQTSISVKPTSDGAVIGKTVDLEIRGSGEAISESSISVTLGNRFPDYEVAFAPSYEGESSYGKLTKTVTINATRKADAPADDNLIATITVKIPSNLKDGDNFTYTVKSGSFETESGAYGTFSGTQQSLPIVAPLSIEAERVLLNHDAVITVSDVDGNPVEGAEISKAETGEVVGTTNAEGTLTTDAFSAQAGNTVIVAKKGEELSFEYTISVYAPQGDESGMPDGIRFNVVDNPATQKSITWISSPLSEGKQVITYAVKGSENWQTLDAESEQMYFSKNSNDSAMVNKAELTGLAPETTYEFKVGTEGAMSDAREFTTGASGATPSKFFVVGDIQSQDTTNIQTIIDNLAASGPYDFGAQAGDATDDPTLYSDWPTLNNIFGDSALGGTSIVNVLGNHEYNGDANGSIASAMYDIDSTAPGSCWSKQYGDLYIAVMNYSTNASQMREAAAWLEEDAKASNAKWRILFTHQPPYFTNATGGNDIVNEILPSAIDAAGIDAVFSGHDHSATRTNPLKAGEQDEKGTVYYICGSTGGKEYSITSQDRFDYDKVFALATIDYNATYLTASIDGDTMSVQINDIANGVIDSFDIESKCHEPQYDPKSDSVSCARCGKAIEDYTGTIKDADGNAYYFFNGKKQTGWVQVGQDWRFFDKNGVEEEVTVKEEQDTTCLIQGYKVFASESGSEKRVEGDVAAGHEYVDQADGSRVCSVCGWKYATLDECEVTLSNDGVGVYNGTPRKPIVTVTTPDGHTLKQSGDGKDYFATYKDENLTEIGPATIELQAYKYGMYVDKNDWRGNVGGTRTVTFKIVPPAPSNVVLNKTATQATLTWDEVLVNDEKVADQYVVYVSENGGDFQEDGTTESTSYTKTDLKSGVDYKFRVGSRCVVDGENYDSKTMTAPWYLKPTVNSSVTNNGKPQLSWTAVDGVRYEVWRAKGSGTFTKLGDAKGGQYVDSKAKVGTEYRYKLKAIKGDSRVWSNVITAECTTAQPDVTISNRVDGKPVVRWDAVNGAAKYQVYRSEKENGTYWWLWTGKGNVLTNASAETGKTYYYKVRGLTANGGKGAFSEPVHIKATSQTVTAKVGNRISDGYPLISWNKISGAAKYQVWRSTSGKTGSFRLLATTTGKQLTNTSAKEGVTYYYKVRPVASNGAVGAYSNVVSRKFMQTAVKVEVTNRASDGSPVLSWNSIPGASKYQVYRSEKENGTYWWLWTGKGQKLTNASAEPGKTYYYKVRAVSAKGTKGDMSTPVSGMRDVSLASPTATITNRIVDGKPKLTWTAVSGASSYDVYVSTDGENGEFTKLFSGKGRVMNHMSAKADVTYTYKVQAVFDGDQLSGFSKTVSGQVESVAMNPKGTYQKNTGMPVISWSKIDIAAKYQVWRSTSGTTGTFTRVLTTTGTQMVDDSVSEGVTYYYKIRPVNASGSVGTYSKVVEMPYMDTDLKIEISNRESDGYPVLKWNEVPGAVKYQLYRSTSGKEGTFNLLTTTKGLQITNTSAAEGQEYYYKVRAVSTNNVKTDFSNVVQGAIAHEQQ